MSNPIIEAIALLVEAQGMNAYNLHLLSQGALIHYAEDDFLRLADKVRAVAHRTVFNSTQG